LAGWSARPAARPDRDRALHDKYASFSELARHEVAGLDYRITSRERPRSSVLVMAPHGGSIEIGTSELAALIAGEEHSLFSFEGLKAHGRNRDLHITSHNFDHPLCLELAARCAVTLGVHGCSGEAQIFIGGLDLILSGLLVRELAAHGLPACADGHRYPGRHPFNICNRSRRGRGAQLEITKDLRDPEGRARIAHAVRSVLDTYEPGRVISNWNEIV